jgi:N-acyl amino acid synthase of PEP-CTERM/exosortase system
MERFRFFTISNNEPLINEVYRLRYKVYCDEWRFEKPEDHPGGLEMDQFDAHSVHIGAVLKENGLLIGTIRIILKSDLGFPIENHCRFDKDLSWLDRARIGEISRLAVSKDYRRRAIDKLLYNDGDKIDEKDFFHDHDERRKTEFLIIMGLYICMYKECVALGLTHWYALMAKGLYLLLSRTGINFQKAGPQVDHHGLRIPYVGSIPAIYDRLRHGKAEYFDAYEQKIVNG